VAQALHRYLTRCKVPTAMLLYDGAHAITEFLFINIFQSDLVLLIGFVLVLQWHARVAFHHQPWIRPVRAILGAPRRNMRRFGLDIIVLQLFYDPTMPDFVKKNRYVASMIMIVFENVLLFEASKLLAETLLKGADKPAEAEPVESNYREMEDTDGDAEGSGIRRLSAVLGMSLPFDMGEINMDEADNMDDPRWDKDDDPDNDGEAGGGTENLYMDLTTPFSGMAPVFLIQIFLLLFYNREMNDPGGDEHKVKKVEFGYWVVGVMIQLYAGEQQLGKPFNRKYWGSLLWAKKLDDSDEECETTAAVAKQNAKIYDCIPGLTYQHEWTLRALMDYLVNGVSRDIIMFTFPIMLCVEEPLDFVKDCTAIFFLTTLDDTPFEKQKSRPRMLTRLKFNMCFENLKARGYDADPIIPLPFTLEEARSVEINEMEWDQFESQREYASPYFKNPHKLKGKVVENREHNGLTDEEVAKFKDAKLLEFMQMQTDGYMDDVEERAVEDHKNTRAAFASCGWDEENRTWS